MTTSTMTELTDDGAWCWFQDPRAVRHVGDRDQTYTGWVTRGGDIEVAAHDHEADEVSTATLHADFEEDDHDAPSVFVDSEGRLLVFYTAHGGPEVCYRRGEEPESVDAFEPEETIEPSTAHTYPNPREIGGDLFLFYRNANGSLAYVASGDDGRTWGDEHELVTTDGRDWCVYFKLSAVHEGEVDVGLTFAEGGGHEPHRDVRHARFDGEVLRDAEGAVVGDGSATFWETPVIFDSDATGHDAWIWDCAVGGGVPELAYAELRAEDDHAYRYARWDGGWRDGRIADAGSHIVEGEYETYYSGGIYLDHELPGVCYYSVGDHGGSELVRAEKGSEAWERTALTADDEQHVRPVVPRNRHDDLRVLWMRGPYRHFANREYETGIVGGD